MNAIETSCRNAEPARAGAPTPGDPPGSCKVLEFPNRPTGRPLRASKLGPGSFPRPDSAEGPTLAQALKVFALALAVLLAWSEYRQTHVATPAPAVVATATGAPA